MKKNFWSKIVESFNVFRYKELSKNGVGESFSDFILFFSIMGIIAILLSVPLLIKMPESIKSELENANEFTINVSINSSAPLYFPPEKPLFSIVNNKSESKGLLVFTKTELIYNIFPFIKPSSEIETYSNVKENSDSVANLAIIFIILVAPSVIVYGYLFNLLKYLIIALAFSFLAKLIISALGKKIKYKKLWIGSLYSLIPLILIEMSLLPFSIPLFYIPFILYIIWYVIITIELIEEF